MDLKNLLKQRKDTFGLINGLYSRVGKKVGKSTYWVSRVSNGHEENADIDMALLEEYNNIIDKLKKLREPQNATA